MQLNKNVKDETYITQENSRNENKVILQLESEKNFKVKNSDLSFSIENEKNIIYNENG